MSHKTNNWSHNMSRGLVALALSLAMSQGAHAQTRWDGGTAGSANWSTATNWNNDTAPASNTALTWGDAAVDQTSTNDAAFITDVSSITFENFAGYDLQGSGVNINTGGFINNNFAGINTITLPLTLEGNTPSDVVAGGTLVFGGLVTNGNFDLTLTGAGNHTFNGTGSYAGAGGLVKNSTGTLTLAGTSAAFTGAATLNDGVTSVTGTIGTAASTMNVNNALATLIGTGTVGGSLTNTSGTIAPGVGSTAALSVGNNLFLTGGTLLVDVNADGTSDSVRANVNATLGGTLSLQGNTSQQGTYFGQSYDVVIADADNSNTTDGVTGQFGLVTSNLGFVGATVSLVDNDNDLTAFEIARVTFNTFALNLESFAQAGNTNQINVARDIQQVFLQGSASSDFKTAFNTFFTLNTTVVGADGLTDMQRALQDLAGEVRTAAISAGLESSSMITGQVLSQLYTTAFSASSFGGKENAQTAQSGAAKFGFANTTSAFGLPPMGGLVSGQTEAGEVDSDPAVWVLAAGTWGDIDPTAVNQGFEYDGQGFELGYTLGSDSEFKWGVQAGFGDNDVDTRGTLDTVEIDSYNVGVHGSYFSEGFYFNGVGGYVHNQYDSRRDIRFAGVTAVGDYDGRELFAYGEVGKIIKLGGDDDEVAMAIPGRNTAPGLLLGGMEHGKGAHKSHKRVEEPVEEEVIEEAPVVVAEESAEGLHIAPLISAHFRHFEQDNYTETGAGALSLAVRDVELDSFQSGLGGRLFHANKTDEGGWIVPELSAKWVHEWGDRDRDVVSSFVGTPQTFSIGGVRPSRDSFQLRAGLTAYTADDWNFDIGYNAELAGNFENHAGVARATWLFE